MKITKAQLRKIITEEVNAYVDEANPQMKRKPKRDFRALITAPVKQWVGSEDYEIKEHAVSVWMDLMNIVQTHWEDQRKTVHGCARNEETPACKTISAVQNLWAIEVQPLMDMAKKGNLKPLRWWSKVLKAMEYVPKSDKPSELMRTKVWQRVGVPTDDDDL